VRRTKSCGDNLRT